MTALRSIRKVHGHDGGTTSLACSPDGTLLASGGYDCQVRLWDVTTLEEKRSIPGHRRGNVAFSPDGSMLVSAGLHKDATVTDCETWQSVHTLPDTATAWGIVFTPDGSRLAVIQPQLPVQMWDTRSWRMVEQVPTHREYITAFCFSPDGSLAALADSNQGTVQFLRPDTLEMNAAFIAHRPVTFGLAFSPDSALLATAGADRFARLWTVSDLENCGEAQAADSMLCVAFAPNGRFLFGGSLDGCICAWNFPFCERPLITTMPPLH